jgi:hypothetical protein
MLRVSTFESLAGLNPKVGTMAILANKERWFYIGGGVWKKLPYSLVPMLTSCLDTKFTALQDGDAIIFDSGIGAWVNRQPAAAQGNMDGGIF